MEPRGQKMESVVSTSTCCTGIERGEMICVAGVAATIESLTKHGVGPSGPCSPAFNTAMEKVVLQLLGVWFGLSNAMQCRHYYYCYYYPIFIYLFAFVFF